MKYSVSSGVAPILENTYAEINSPIIQLAKSSKLAVHVASYIDHDCSLLINNY